MSESTNKPLKIAKILKSIRGLEYWNNVCFMLKLCVTSCWLKTGSYVGMVAQQIVDYTKVI